MANEQATNGKEFDPMASLREMRDGYLDAWAKAMVEAVNTEAYAKASGAMLNTCLSASSPFRETLEKTMLQALQQLSMPSRADFVSLAERAVNIEMRLDDMEAALERIEKLLVKPAGRNRAAKPAGGRQVRKVKKGAK